jgi:hypothetical protein
MAKMANKKHLKQPVNLKRNSKDNAAFVAQKDIQLKIVGTRTKTKPNAQHGIKTQIKEIKVKKQLT